MWEQSYNVHCTGLSVKILPWRKTRRPWPNTGRNFFLSNSNWIDFVFPPPGQHSVTAAWLITLYVPQLLRILTVLTLFGKKVNDYMLPLMRMLIYLLLPAAVYNNVFCQVNNVIYLQNQSLSLLPTFYNMTAHFFAHILQIYFPNQIWDFTS